MPAKPAPSPLGRSTARAMALATLCAVSSTRSPASPTTASAKRAAIAGSMRRY
jgi:hypothetical protein